MPIGRLFSVMPLGQKPDVWLASVGSAAVHMGQMTAGFYWTGLYCLIFSPCVQDLRNWDSTLYGNENWSHWASWEMLASQPSHLLLKSSKRSFVFRHTVWMGMQNKHIAGFSQFWFCKSGNILLKDNFIYKKMHTFYLKPNLYILVRHS